MSILPRSLFYAYTFLVSTVVQIDPTGKQPKCMLYAHAGLETLQVKAKGLERKPSPSRLRRNIKVTIVKRIARICYTADVFPPGMGIGDTAAAIRHIACIHADLLIYQAEYLLMRSSFEDADKVRCLLSALILGVPKLEAMLTAELPTGALRCYPVPTRARCMGAVLRESHARQRSTFPCAGRAGARVRMLHRGIQDGRAPQSDWNHQSGVHAAHSLGTRQDCSAVGKELARGHTQRPAG